MTRPRPRYSLGPAVARWIERVCVHGPGDILGQPVVLTDEERRFLAWAYEVDETGRRIVRRAVRGLPKGSRKTEFAAWVALAELAGPVRFDRFDELTRKKRPRGKPVRDPYVVAGASTYEQADLLFAAARAIITEGPLADFFDCYDREIQRRDGPGRLVRVPAVAGANDGLRPTFCVFDETHEWVAAKKRVHLVLENGLSKRSGAWSLSITTAGNPADDSVARDQYDYGRRILTEELDDPSYLFQWRESAVDLESLSDPDALLTAVKDANPEEWKRPEELASRYREIPLHEFARYHLNRWALPDEERWLPPGAWDALHTDYQVPDGSNIVLGFDGSYSGDSTALIGATVSETPHLWVLGLWEHPGGAATWTVDHDEVEAAVHDAFRRYRVVELAADPPYWAQQIDRWAEMYGEDRVLAFQTMVRKRMAAAVSTFYQAVTTGSLTHDGHPGLARHVDAAVLKESAQGAYIVKESKSSPRKIDAAIAAVISYARASWWHSHPAKPATVGFVAL